VFVEIPHGRTVGTVGPMLGQVCLDRARRHLLEAKLMVLLADCRRPSGDEVLGGVNPGFSPRHCRSVVRGFVEIKQA